MSKIRINDLARELEVKSKAILDVLPLVGVTEKKTHSSSIEEHEAVKVRAYLRGGGDSQGSAAKASRSSRPDADEIRTKIDLSHISKPGDVLNAIRAKQQTPAPDFGPRGSSAPSSHNRTSFGGSQARCLSSGSARDNGPTSSTNADSSSAVGCSSDLAASDIHRPRASGAEARTASSGCASGHRAAEARTAGCDSAGSPDCGASGDGHSVGSVRACSTNSSSSDHSKTRDSDCSAPASEDDRSADRTASRVSGPSTACGTPPVRGRCDSGQARSRTSGSRSANIPAPASRWSADVSCATASGRTASHASDAAIAHGRASSRRRPCRTASRPHASRKPSRRAFAQAWTALRSSRRKRRPDEGLRAAAAVIALERAAADHAHYHDF